MKTMLTTTVLSLTTAGLVGLPATAALADDDRKKRSGSCSGSSGYTMTLRDAGDDPDRLRATFFVNSNKGAGKKWTVTVKRGGTVVHKVTKRTNRAGNLTVSKRFRGDDDARVRVVARAGYGERCSRTMRLDD